MTFTYDVEFICEQEDLDVNSFQCRIIFIFFSIYFKVESLLFDDLMDYTVYWAPGQFLT